MSSSRKYNTLIIGQLINETQFHNYWGKVLTYETFHAYRRMCTNTQFKA